MPRVDEMKARDRYLMIEPLLTALETERHCRVPLLRAVLDELHDCREHSGALAAASACVGSLLEELESHPVEEAVYLRRLASTRRLVEAASYVWNRVA
jgi:hypothetical protein